MEQKIVSRKNEQEFYKNAKERFNANKIKSIRASFVCQYAAYMQKNSYIGHSMAMEWAHSVFDEIVEV